jgi:hypothetical protein
VTVPEFADRAMTLRIHADLLSLLLIPVVQGEARQQWETYSSLNHSWIDDGLALEEQSYNHRGLRHLSEETGEIRPIRRLSSKDSIRTVSQGKEARNSRPRGLENLDYRNGVAPSIFRYDLLGNPMYQESEGPYCPIWQMSPMLPEYVELVNFDTSSSPVLSVGLQDGILLSKRQAVLSKAYRVGRDDTETSQERDFVDSLFQSRANLLREEEDGQKGSDVYWTYQGEPLSNLFYPILDAHQATVVAVLAAHIDWRTYLSNIPQGTGLVCVLDNECDDQKFTFAIHEDGMAHYIGEGDLHDSQFNGLVETLRVGSFVNVGLAGLTLSPDDTGCPHALYIYPSTASQSDFYTRTPMGLLLLILLLFLVLVLLFIFHDCLVEKRHRILKRLARESNAVVASIFPTTLRLFPFADEDSEDSESRTSEPSKKSSPSNDWGAASSDGTLSLGTFDLTSCDGGQGGGQSAKQRLRNYLREGSTADDAVLAKPLADLVRVWVRVYRCGRVAALGHPFCKLSSRCLPLPLLYTFGSGMRRWRVSKI